jgi:hypothetical protein
MSGHPGALQLDQLGGQRSGLAALGGHMPVFGVCEGAYLKALEEEQLETPT